MEESTARAIISVFVAIHWFSAALFGLAGLALLVLGPGLIALVGALGYPTIGSILGSISILAAIVLLFLAICEGVIAHGLAKLRPWARIACIVAAVGAILSITGGDIIGLVIGAAELYFFGFDKTVKELFVAR